MMRSAAFASSALAQTYTPLPAAIPSALITHAPLGEYGKVSTNAVAAVMSVNAWYAAVGIPAACINCLENSLLDSSCAAAWFRPNTAMPSAIHASAMPAAKAASGPTTTMSTAFASANTTSASTSSGVLHGILTLIVLGSAAVPALPGATYSRVTPALDKICRASACSRPPEPMRRMVCTTLVTHFSPHNFAAPLRAPRA